MQINSHKPLVFFPTVFHFFGNRKIIMDSYFIFFDPGETKEGWRGCLGGLCMKFPNFLPIRVGKCDVTVTYIDTCDVVMQD